MAKFTVGESNTSVRSLVITMIKKVTNAYKSFTPKN